MKILGRVRHSVYAIPLVVAAGLAMLVISETTYLQSNARLAVLRAKAQTRADIDYLLQRVTDAETGQRGYLLTGRDEYLAPYEDATRDIDSTLAKLHQVYADTPAPRAKLGELDAAVQAKLSETRTVLAAYRQDPAGSWRDLMLSDIGREQMQLIRQLGEDLLSMEQVSVVADRARLQRALLLNRFGIALMVAIGVGALIMYLRQGRQLQRRVDEHRQQIVDERDRLEQEVATRTQQLTELTRHLQTAREDERSRLARDLHDELGALLTAAKLDAARIRARLGDSAPEALERLEHLVQTLNSGIALKRRIIEDLRPSSLNNLGLVPALEILCDEFAERSGLTVRRTVDAVPLSASAELTVYRLVQEGLTNIAKYAQASTVDVRVQRASGGQVEVSVRDDGRGFDTTQQDSTRHGLLGMRYRVESEGGRLRVESATGLGTELRAVLPPASQPASQPASP